MAKVMLLGARIRELRLRAGLSQSDLAKLCYVSRQTVSNWECARTLPDVESLPLVAEALDVTISELLGESAPLIVEQADADLADLGLYTILSFVFETVAYFFILARMGDSLESSTVITAITFSLVGASLAFASVAQRVQKRHNIRGSIALASFLETYFDEKVLRKDGDLVGVPLARLGRLAARHWGAAQLLTMGFTCLAAWAISGELDEPAEYVLIAVIIAAAAALWELYAQRRRQEGLVNEKR